MRLKFLGGIIALVICGLDQWSKHLILQAFLEDPAVLTVTPFFNLLLTWNKGVSFGFFHDLTLGTWILTGVALVITLWLFIWLWRSTTFLSIFSLSLIIGGAIGNIIDRIRFQAVVDFLDFHWGHHHWPAFNLADTAICIGVALMVVEHFIFSKKDDEKQRERIK